MTRDAYTADQLAYRAAPARAPSLDAKYYRVRLAKGSPFSALKVWWGSAIDPVTQEVMCERPGMWRAVLNGEHVPIEDVSFLNDDAMAEPVIRGEIIDEIDYEVLLRTYLRAKVYEPDSPQANPRKKVDPLYCTTSILRG